MNYADPFPPHASYAGTIGRVNKSTGPAHPFFEWDKDCEWHYCLVPESHLQEADLERKFIHGRPQDSRCGWRSTIDGLNGALESFLRLWTDRPSLLIVLHTFRRPTNPHGHIYSAHRLLLFKKTRIYAERWHKDRDPGARPESTQTYICATNMAQHRPDGARHHGRLEGSRR